MELSHQHLLAVLLWILWCSLHSALIAASVTGYMKKKLGDAYRFYRLLYNIVALITFIPLVLYSISLEKAPIFRSEHDVFAASGILSAIRHPWYAGGILIIWARDISLFAFLNNIVISAYFVIGAYLGSFVSSVRSTGNTRRMFQCCSLISG